MEGRYNATPQTVEDGQPLQLQIDANGNLKTTALSDAQIRAAPLPVSISGGGMPVTGTVSVDNFPASQPVSIASMPSTPVTGTFWQTTQPVSLASLPALAAGANTIGTTLGPALAKGTQGSTGYSTQDLKDAGRVVFSAATVIGGVTAVTTEALLSMVPTRDGVASAAATSFAVTANKRLRIQVVAGGLTSTAAAAISGRLALRMSPSGAVTATSPIIAILTLHSPGALAQEGDHQEIQIPDGLELSGAMQFGLSQVGNVATGTFRASVVGYEY